MILNNMINIQMHNNFQLNINNWVGISFTYMKEYIYEQISKFDIGFLIKTYAYYSIFPFEGYASGLISVIAEYTLNRMWIQYQFLLGWINPSKMANWIILKLIRSWFSKSR